MTDGIAHILIGGEWRMPRAAALHVLCEPASGTPLGRSADCQDADFAAAQAAAREAAPAWRALDAGERDALLARAASRMLERVPELARTRARESGRPFFECLDELHAAVRLLAAAHSPSASVAAGVRAESCEETVVPADTSLSEWIGRLAPALRSGLTVSCAVSAETPLALLAAAACFDMFPPGVLNVLTALHPAAGGNAVQGAGDAAAPAGAHCLCVARGADAELAVAAAAWWRLQANGRTAGRCARLYVEEPGAERFADALHACMAMLECGDPTRPGTDLGPLRTAHELRALEDQLERALRRGVRLRLGGRRFQPWGLSGYFFQPTLLFSRGEEESLDCEAFRGPVAIVTAVTDLGAALSRHTAHARLADLTLLAPDPDVLARLFAGAGIAARIHAVQHRETHWFPYEARMPELARAAGR